MERVMNPNLHASVRGYVAEAQKHAQSAGQSVNEWSKVQLGVDVVDRVNDVVGTVKDRVGAGPAASGYGSLALQNEGEASPLYDDTNELFHEYSDMSPTSNTSKPVSDSHMTQTPSGGKAKKDDDWDDWDF